MTDAVSSLDPDNAARLLHALAKIDLASADGRAGLGAVLREIGRRCPDTLLNQAAAVRLEAIAARRDG